jgi:hypothetical protein
VPDYRDKVVAGGDPANTTPANRLYSGAEGATGKTSSDATGVTVDGHAITLAEMRQHRHDDGSYAVGTGISGESSKFYSVSSNNPVSASGGSTYPATFHSRTDTLTLTSGNVSGYSGYSGSSQAHDHGITDPTHDHDTGMPPRTYMEFYVRVA